MIWEPWTKAEQAKLCRQDREKKQATAAVRRRAQEQINHRQGGKTNELVGGKKISD